MRRITATVVAVLALLATVSACSGQSPYCELVEENTSTLNSFGKERTDKAYATYSSTFRDVAKASPAGVKDDWTMLADVTDGVIDAQAEVGLKLEDMQDEDQVTELEPDELEQLNGAYEAFNGTADQRTAVVKNVKQECEITLK